MIPWERAGIVLRVVAIGNREVNLIDFIFWWKTLSIQRVLLSHAQSILVSLAAGVLSGGFFDG